MNRIDVSRTNAVLDITSRRAQLRITTPRPEMKVVRRSRTRMVVNRTAPRLHINWNKVRTLPMPAQRIDPRSHGLGDDYQVEVSRRAARQSGVSQHDDQWAQIRGARLSRSRSSMVRRAVAGSEVSPVQARAASIASALEWELGKVDIDWEIERMQVEWSIARPRVEVEPYSVEIRLRNYPKVHISYNPDRVVKVMGKRLDRRI